MKRRKNILLIGGLFVFVALLWWWMQRETKPSPLQASKPPSSSTPASKEPNAAVTPQAQEEKRKAAVDLVVSALATPIEFYGRVVDQNGDPVAGATVGFSALDKFMAPGSGYTGTSDENGLFSISGIKGARLSVNVRKEGYYFIDSKSNASFAYGTGSDGYFRAPPTKSKPATFILQKAGEKVALLYASGGQIDVPKTGKPLGIDLATGRSGQGSLEVTSWIGDAKKRPFDWRYQLSVPNGGIIERTGQFDFEAPADGYQPAIEISMAATAEKWSSDVTRTYFAKLPDGRYARFSINFYPGQRNFIVLESYVNPKPGSRNLEFDPKQQVKSP